MNSTKPIAHDKLHYALHLIRMLPRALIAHVDPLDAIRERLDALDGRTCTGNPHWRDKNAAGKTAKLYILHYTDQTCPVHGQPPPGKRNRVYIGSKPDRIADALAAIERNTERLDLQRQRNRLQSSIAHLTYQIKNIYRNLRHFPPEPGEHPQPIPHRPD